MLKKIILLLLLITNAQADIINGNTDPVGVPRNLSTNTLFAGYDSSETTSVKNHILTNVSGDNLRTFTSTSLLALHNTTLELDGTYTFSHGAIEVTGDVVITGNSSHTFRFEAASLFIATGSSLTIDENIIFEFAPTFSHRKAIYFEDGSSKLILNSGTLKVATGMGMHLAIGNLIVQGNSTVDNTSTDTDQALFLGAGPSSAGDCTLKIKAGAKLTVKNAGIVYKNIGSGGLDLSEGKGVLKVENDSNFLFEETTNMGNIGGSFDFHKLRGKEGRDIPAGSSLPTAFREDNYLERVFEIRWAGQYVAVTVNGTPNPSQMHIYRVDPSGGPSATLVASTPDLVNTYRVDWTPDGKFLAVGRSSGTQGVSIYYFDASSEELVLVAEDATFNCVSIRWSKDGRYLAVGVENLSTLNIYKFRAGTGTLRKTQAFVAEAGTEEIFYTSWSPNSRRLIYSDAFKTRLTKFDEINGTLTITNTVDTTLHLSGSILDFAPDGQHIAASGNSDVEILNLDLNVISNYNFSGTSRTRWFSFSPYGRFLLITETGGVDDSVQIVRTSLTAGANLESETVLSESFSTFSALVSEFSPDGKYIAFGEITDGGATETEFKLFTTPFGSKDPQAIIQNSNIKLSQDLTLENIELKAS